MIANFNHKGLQQYYEAGNGSKLPTQYLRKINRLFDQLDAVNSINDIQQMGFNIHKLTGDLAEYWAVIITPNYRIIFPLKPVMCMVYDVDYIDYH